MADVYNWHLGRKMSYVFPEAHPEKQFVAIFNINRCIGCQTCTGACKATWTFSKGQEYMWWNNVETNLQVITALGYQDLQMLDEAHQAAGVKAEWDTTEKRCRSLWRVQRHDHH
jgi:nitrate reductase beta subunit